MTTSREGVVSLEGYRQSTGLSNNKDKLIKDSKSKINPQSGLKKKSKQRDRDYPKKGQMNIKDMVKINPLRLLKIKHNKTPTPYELPRESSIDEKAGQLNDGKKDNDGTDHHHNMTGLLSANI